MSPETTSHDFNDDLGGCVKKKQDEARAADNGADLLRDDRAPLPWRFAVKDNIAVRGMPYTAGLPCFEQRVALADATVVATLKSAGAVFSRMASTDSGGLGVTTPSVQNPRVPGRTCGGSSGGSAAAVASGSVDFALGTDTGGSVRIPAACCGVLGFKPSHDALSLTGAWPVYEPFDTIGVLARSIDQLANAYFAMQPQVAGCELPPNLGIDEKLTAGLDASVARSMDAALHRLQAGGFSITTVSLPDEDWLVQAHGTLVLDSIRHHYADIPDAELEVRLGPVAAAAVGRARRLAPAAVVQAQHDVRKIRELWQHIPESVSMLIGPTLAVEVPQVGQRKVRVNGEATSVVAALIRKTVLANIVGCPAISVPGGEGHSLQLMSRSGTDAGLLSSARQIIDALRSDHNQPARQVGGANTP